MAKVNKLASWLETEYHKGNKIVKFIIDHENVMFCAVEGALIMGIFTLLGKYVDNVEDRNRALSDAIVVARTSLHECPEAAKIIDEHNLEKDPMAAGINEALAYLSEKGQISIDSIGDDFTKNWKHVACVPEKILTIPSKEEVSKVVKNDGVPGETEKQDD